MFVPLTTTDRFFAKPQLIERLLKSEEIRELAALAEAREVALVKIKELDKQELAELAPVDKEILAATKAEQDALDKWKAARSRLSSLENKRGTISAVYSVRRARLENDITAGTPPRVGKYLAEKRKQLDDLHRREAVLSTEVLDDDVASFGTWRGFPKTVISGSGPSLLARSEGLVEAIRKAKELGSQSLGEEELAKRLADLDAEIPEVKSAPLRSAPLRAALEGPPPLPRRPARN